MRIGQNPSKMRGSPAYQPRQIGLASLTYVPAFEGYFREAREVFDVHLASLRASLDRECDLCVFDNGSCAEMVEFLQERWRNKAFDWLVLSHHNLGKNGALNWIFSAMPNDFIGYADSDVLFRPGWLQRSLEIFAAFERAGMVSAQPVFFDFLRGQGQTAAMINAHQGGLKLELIQPRPEVVEEYCDGINASPEMRLQFQQTRLQVVESQTHSLQAVTSATDMQFMVPRPVARKLVPLPIAGALTAADAIEIPRGIESLGYWILSSTDPLVRHLGNTVLDSQSSEIRQHLQQGSLPALGPSQALPNQHPPTQQEGWKHTARRYMQKQIDRFPTLRRGAARIYDGLFSLLYEERQ
jgi:hypothetical protein